VKKGFQASLGNSPHPLSSEERGAIISFGNDTFSLMLARGLEFLEIRIHDAFEVFRDFEDGNEMLIDLHLLAGARVARHTAFAFLRPETAEAADLDVLPFLQRFDDGLNEAVNDRFGLDFG